MTADFTSPIPPVLVVIERGELEFRVGPGGDLAFSDIRALRRQHEAQARQAGWGPEWPLSTEHVRALLAVMRHFPGAEVTDDHRL